MATDTPVISKKRFWTGYILGALPALFMIVTGLSMAVIKPPSAVESFAQFGYPADLLTPISIVEALCAILYLIPRTSMFGALFLTAYFGGATATHVRIHDPLFVVPIVTCILIWVALYLRDSRLSVLLSFRT